MSPNDLTQFYDAIIYNMRWYRLFIKHVIARVHAHVPFAQKHYVPQTAKFSPFFGITYTQRVFEKWEVYAQSGAYMLQPREW